MPTSEQRSKAAEHFRAKNAARRASFGGTARQERRALNGTFGRLPARSFNRLAAGTTGNREESAGQ